MFQNKAEITLISWLYSETFLSNSVDMVTDYKMYIEFFICISLHPEGLEIMVGGLQQNCIRNPNLKNHQKNVIF